MAGRAGGCRRGRPAVAPPWQWPIAQAGGWPVRLGLAVLVTTALAAGLTVAATGRLTRWLPSLRTLPTAAAAAAAAGTSLFDAGLLALLAAQVLPGISPDAGSAATGDPGVSPHRTHTGWLP